MLGLVACVALNIWCFQVHAILGFVSLNVTKHVLIAQLCHAVGLNRGIATANPGAAIAPRGTPSVSPATDP